MWMDGPFSFGREQYGCGACDLKPADEHMVTTCQAAVLQEQIAHRSPEVGIVDRSIRLLLPDRDHLADRFGGLFVERYHAAPATTIRSAPGACSDHGPRGPEVAAPVRPAKRKRLRRHKCRDAAKIDRNRRATLTRPRRVAETRRAAAAAVCIAAPSDEPLSNPEKKI
jgi:hypothetical protein